MTSKSMTFRFPLPLAQAIEAQARATGKDRTTVVAEALSQVLGLSLPAKATITLEMLQRQVEQVESSITSLSERLGVLQHTTQADRVTASWLERLQEINYLQSQKALLSIPTENSAVESSSQASSDPTRPSEVNSLKHELEQLKWQPTTCSENCLESQTSLPKHILATMTDPIFVCDRAQRLLYINPLGARSLGVEASSALQSAIPAFNLPPDIKAQLTRQFESVFLTGRSITSEISLTTPLAGIQPYEYTLSPLQGTVDHIEAALFSAKNITERKQVEAALQASKANYWHLFEYTNDSVLILDALTHQILDANTNASNRLGYTRQELLSLSLDAMAPQWSSELASELSQRLRTNGMSLSEHSLRHKDGTAIPVEIHSRLIEYGERLAIQSFIRECNRLASVESDRC